MNKGLAKRNPISFSIWLMPEESLKNQLSRIINALSEKYGGPTFEPHVTLVSGFLGKERILLKKAKALSNKIKPFEVIFDKVTYLNEFFRSIFLEVKLTDVLQNAKELACKEFDDYRTDYLPHMSLAYGNYNLSTKLQMVGEIGIIPDGFWADKIFLAHNNEIDLKWKVIRDFKLNS